ncbi:hypothetical protein [Haladaptatus paucihalophilus]|uniref:Uncharacterized protein n=1 Tax=Haladaptatus paucihalophilus DX253 TaxID=797209 RepID=A0A1M7BBA6_HALPU|nr:hypothetical protein [Haladaptatus paucihalophilus]SHL52305.1 hypothetical protein SAMN05444342_4043 [Haladaptatus paucihalophilus DX253]
MTAKRFAILLAAAVLLSVAAPAFATTGTDGLTVGVSQNESVVVTVTTNGTAAENASVSVEALNNSTYAGAGSYTTDESGTIALPTPANNTTIHVVATKGNLTDSTTVALVAPANEDVESDDSFGHGVSSFVHKLLSGEDVKHPGRVISTWVTSHNPGAQKKADHAKSSHDADDHPGNGHGAEHEQGHGADGDHPGNGHDDHPGNGRDNGHKQGHDKGKKGHDDRGDDSDDE